MLARRSSRDVVIDTDLGDCPLAFGHYQFQSKRMPIMSESVAPKTVCAVVIG